ncbi:hypothetical protein, partial [Burkholderia ubonensis]|uniref:hypothetical protein n=1 Tax=Burkholderia ubonensis TaxID=101571 RepID=UPI001E3FC09C
LLNAKTAVPSAAWPHPRAETNCSGPTKHAGDPSETEFEVDRIQPVSMIMRAVPMVEPLGGPFSDEMKAFSVWLQKHPDL